METVFRNIDAQRVIGTSLWNLLGQTLDERKLHNRPEWKVCIHGLEDPDVVCLTCSLDENGQVVPGTPSFGKIILPLDEIDPSKLAQVRNKLSEFITTLEDASLG
jgi:hypothetical protein